MRVEGNGGGETSSASPERLRERPGGRLAPAVRSYVETPATIGKCKARHGRPAGLERLKPPGATMGS